MKRVVPENLSRVPRRGAPPIEAVLAEYKRWDLALASDLSRASTWREVREALLRHKGAGCTDPALNLLPEEERNRILLLVAGRLTSITKRSDLVAIGKYFSGRHKEIIWAMLPHSEKLRLTHLYQGGE